MSTQQRRKASGRQLSVAVEPAASRIAALEKNVTQIERALARARKGSEKLRAFFENARDVLVCIDQDGRITDINNAVTEVFGYAPQEVLGRLYSEVRVFGPNTLQGLVEGNVSSTRGDRVEFEARRKDGARIFVEVTYRTLRKGSHGARFICIVRDVTDRKEMEERLENRRHHLEELVRERTASLQDANAALKVLLTRREEDKKDLEQNVLYNVEQTILPHVRKLQAGRVTYEQRAILEIVAANVKDLVSSFSRRLSSRQFNFTPSELRVANYIKHGRSTKEIAQMTNLSVNTVLFHRASVRRKLGIARRKLNLRSHLQLLPD